MHKELSGLFHLKSTESHRSPGHLNTHGRGNAGIVLCVGGKLECLITNDLEVPFCKYIVPNVVTREKHWG